MDKNYAAQDIIDNEDLDAYLDAEIYEAYGSGLGLDLADLADWYGEAEQAYAGSYGSDAEFAEELATELGMVNANACWPNDHIDWDWAASDLMMDHFEEDGHYFRNL